MTRNEFILQIKDEIKGSCALPYSIPDREINRIIDQSKKWFFINYNESVESKYYVVNKELFNTPEFKSARSIKLPDCVVAVTEVKEISGGGRLFSADPDFTDTKYFASEIFLSPFQSDDLVMRTAQYAYWDLSKAFFLEVVAHDFNQNTSRLNIKGRTPKKNLFIDTYVQIPEENLFEDWYFIRFVTATVKKALGRILGFFEYNLPGGVSINVADIKSEGEEELRELKEEIDSQNSPDWFFMFHSLAPYIALGGSILSLITSL